MVLLYFRVAVTEQSIFRCHTEVKLFPKGESLVSEQKRLMDGFLQKVEG